MKIYTKTGDAGQTGLFGGDRVTKTHPRLEAYGALDELNAHLGLAIVSCSEENAKYLKEVQSRLFDIGSHLATPSSATKAKTILPPLEIECIEIMEKKIDELEDDLPPMKNFILPGGNELAARLHVARAVCRRAERAVVGMKYQTEMHPLIIPYLNRLSDYLFVLSRAAVIQAGDEEIPWIPNSPKC
ncbi:MAG: cob(I)yrinic acid a,c-diamide adenosyltransferase [Candidatus Eisenbacteria bacterium]|uniref:Corrinoid adenosyltransferase n=1 Tax=Eiseniibacteriota bacterium TaxID=2212470 RepID=A0A7Y2ECE1_UNCEI|nr:cob(I)yrinic acid a,c-diamide adenosyltransferase [Candidatus Eisenbacteria bacterium]